MLRLLRPTGRNESSIREIVKKEKNCDSFAVAPKTAKVMATVCNKCLGRVEKALNLWGQDMNRKHVGLWQRVVPERTEPIQDFHKGHPGTSNLKPCTASKGWL